MKLDYGQLLNRMKKKARKSSCHFKISAIGFDHRGRPIGITCNRPRFTKDGGGHHAEMLLMRQSPPNLRTILICRVNSTGDLLPIHPCKACKRKADLLGIRIKTVEE